MGRDDEPGAQRSGRRGAIGVGAKGPGPGGSLAGEPLSFDRQTGARRATSRAKAQWGQSPRSRSRQGAGKRLLPRTK